MTPCELETESVIGRGFAGSEAGRNGIRKGLRDEETDRKIEQTIAYMTQHLNRPLPVARLAALANISPSHFFALFKRRTGCAPIDFFIRLRMHHACRLLDQTSLNVKEIAAALGYDDPFYFSRVFKSVNRVAPTEYRTIRKESKDRTSALLPSGLCNRRNDDQKGQRTSDGWRKFAPTEQFHNSQTAAAISVS